MCVCFCTSQTAHLSRSSPGVGFHPNLHPNQGFIRVRDIYCCCVNWFQNMPELYKIAHYLQPSPTSSPVSRTCEASEKSEAFLCVLGVGGTRTGFKVLLEGVSCVCGRTSSFPAGERNQRLPGAGEVSMRHAGPRPPLRQISCVGGASQGRPERGSLRFRTNGPVENVPFSTMGLCLGEERRGG